MQWMAAFCGQRRTSASARSRLLPFVVAAALCFPFMNTFLHAQDTSQGAIDREKTRRIANIAEEFCSRLQMTAKIDAIIVDENKYGVSVEPVANQENRYTLSFDRKLLESLTSDELSAAIAHETGHIWIFTHHPFLQTEELANEIAFRVVSRDMMKEVYSKLWIHLGITGNIEEVLGPDPQTAAVRNAAVIHP